MLYEFMFLNEFGAMEWYFSETFDRANEAYDKGLKVKYRESFPRQDWKEYAPVKRTKHKCLSYEQFKLAVKLTKDLTLTKIAKQFNVSVVTIHNLLNPTTTTNTYAKYWSRYRMEK